MVGAELAAGACDITSSMTSSMTCDAGTEDTECSERCEPAECTVPDGLLAVARDPSTLNATTTTSLHTAHVL